MWPSREFLALSRFADLEKWASVDLFEAQIHLPAGLRELAALAVEAWRTQGGFETVDLPTLHAARYVEGQEEKSTRVYRRRVLDLPRPSTEELLNVRWGAGIIGPLEASEEAHFRELWSASVARQEFTLEQWVTARDRQIIDEVEFADGAVVPFMRAVSTGFRKGNGFGDARSFLASAPAVGARDPDTCLRGLVVLASCFNENGLRQQVRDWDSVVPKTGFSPEVLAEVSRHFSKANERAAAKILNKLLAKRGIVVSTPEPPALATIDETFEVGTDVAYLIVGSFDAVLRVSALEDMDDFFAAAAKANCVAFTPGGDGTFRVRVTGKSVEGEVIGTFPLTITGDALTVSGVVGAGGMPTIAFPSGKYRASLMEHSGGELDYTVVVGPLGDKAAPRRAKQRL